MKQNILFIILIMIGIGSGYFTGEYVGKSKTEAKYQSAPSRRDTTTKIIYREIPSQKKEVKPKPKITPQHIANADSIFALAFQRGVDSARSIFSYYTAPRETLITFDSSGELLHLSDRLREMEIYTFTPFPRKEIEHTITDSIYVKIPEEREWWRTPAYIVGAFAVGWVSSNIINK